MARYFVGSGTNWSSTSSWATSSGGASGAAVPTSTDDVFLDVNSPGNLTIDVAASCQSINCTGFTHTLIHNSGITLSIGSATAGASSVALLFVSGMTYTLGSATTSTVSFVSTSSTTQTIATGGQTVAAFTFNGTGGSWEFTSNVTMGNATTNIVTLTAGSLNTNGYTLTCGGVSSSNSNTRSLTLGASTITLTSSSNNTTIWSFGTTTNLTFSCGTSTISFNGNGLSMAGGGLTYATVTFNATSGGNCAMSGNNTFGTLTYTNDTSIQDAVSFSGNQTITGTLTVTGSSVTEAIYFISNALGNTRTITAASVSLTNVFFQDMTGAGAAAPFTGTNIGDGGGNSVITVNSARTLYWIGNGGNMSTSSHWSLTSGGSSASTTPLPQDSVIFDANSFSSTAQTVTMNVIWFTNFDASAATNSPTFNLNVQATIAYEVFGYWKNTSSMSLTGTKTVNFCGRNSFNITNAGIQFPSSVYINAPNGTYALNDNMSLNSSSTLELQNGTFNANGNSLTTGLFNSAVTNTRTLEMGSGTWTLTGTGQIWFINSSTGWTLSGSNATITPTDTSSSTKTLVPVTGDTYGMLTIPNNSSGAYLISPTGTVTFSNFKFGTGTTHTFLSGRTIKFTNAPNLTGSSGNVITINSSSAGTQSTFSYASGVVSGNYLSLQDSNAIGGAVWYAGANSTNVSDNTGWAFYNPAVGNSTFFMMGGA